MRHMLIVTHSGSATRVGMRLSGLRCYPGRIAETLAAIRHCAKTPVQAGMGAHRSMGSSQQFQQWRRASAGIA